MPLAPYFSIMVLDILRPLGMVYSLQQRSIDVLPLMHAHMVISNSLPSDRRQ